jgi:hypothetical protein
MKRQKEESIQEKTICVKDAESSWPSSRKNQQPTTKGDLTRRLIFDYISEVGIYSIPSEIWLNFIYSKFNEDYELHIFRFLSNFFYKLVHCYCSKKYNIINYPLGKVKINRFNISIQYPLENMALSGNVKLFQWLFEWGRHVDPISIYNENFKKTIIQNILKYDNNNNNNNENNNENTELFLKYLCKINYKINKEIILYFIKKGNLNFLKWIKDNNVSIEEKWYIDEYYLHESIKNNQFEILKWLKIENNCPWVESSGSQYNPLLTSNRFREDGFLLTPPLTKEQTKPGGTKYMNNRADPYTRQGVSIVDTCNVNTKTNNDNNNNNNNNNGNNDNNNNNDDDNIDKYEYNININTGEVEKMKRIKGEEIIVKKYYIPKEPSTIAIFYKRFEILRWCIESGCPWSESACCVAAYIKNIEILQWCINNGCSWDKFAYIYASQDRNTLIWCVENKGIPNKARICKSICNIIAGNGNLELLEWFKNKWNFRLNSNSITYNAAKNGQLETFD